MGKEIEYNRKECFKIRAENDDKWFFEPCDPSLDYAPISFYEEEDYLNRPLLINRYDSYFSLAYLIELKDWVMKLGVSRKRTDGIWNYISSVDNVTRFIDTHSMTVKRSCSSPGEMKGFVRSLPMGSFLEITEADGVQTLGIYKELSAGKICLTFGFDSESHIFEDLSVVDFRKRDLGENVWRGKMKTVIALDDCVRISQLAMKDGVSGTEDISDGSGDNEVHSIVRRMMKDFCSGPFAKLLIKFDRTRISTSFENGDEIIEGPSYNSLSAYGMLIRLKLISDIPIGSPMNQKYFQSLFKYDVDGAKHALMIHIHCYEHKCYSITIEKI